MKIERRPNDATAPASLLLNIVQRYQTNRSYENSFNSNLRGAFKFIFKFFN